MSIAERYKIIERLGEQKVRKFGNTFLIKEKNGNELFVLKAVNKEEKVPSERLRNEASFDFKTRGLPQVVEFYESDSELMLVKRYVKGVDLNTKWQSLKKREKHPFIIAVFQQLSPLFEELSKQNIVHGDLKPSNIIISENDHSIEVNLIDFGLSLRTNEVEERDILFPLGFAAPELLLNQLDIVDQRTDIYALGVLIWKLWCGMLPLTHPNPSIFTNLQLTHPIPDHSTLPKGYYAIIDKMTKKHSFKIPPNKMKREALLPVLKNAMNERYANLSEIQDDLSQLEVRVPFYQRISLR